MSDPSLLSLRCADRENTFLLTGRQGAFSRVSEPVPQSTFYCLPLPSQPCSCSYLVPSSVYSFLASLLSFIFVATD